MEQKDNVGKFISLILRHHPECIGMKLDEHGWARTEDLIAGIAKNREFDMQMLEEIVRTDSKQRYSFDPGESGAFRSGGCGTGAKDSAGCFMAWNR